MLLRSKSSAQYAQAQRIAARLFYRDYAVIGQAGGEPEARSGSQVRRDR
jgi:hypothetical protein